MASVPPPPRYPPPPLASSPESAGAPGQGPPAADDEPDWAPWLAPAAFLAGVVATLAANLVVGIVGVIAGANVRHAPPAVLIAGTFLGEVALVAVALAFASSRGGLDPRRFGLRPTAWGPALRWMAFTVAAYLTFNAAWSAALQLHEKDNLPSQLGADRSAVALVAVAVLVSVIAPLAEETFFRGFFFSALRNWRGPWPAAVITGLVFGAVHAAGSPPGYLVPLAFLGFLFALVRWRTGSLYPCVALHSLNNATAFAVLRHWPWWEGAALAVGALALIAGVLASLARYRVNDAGRAAVA